MTAEASSPTLEQPRDTLSSTSAIERAHRRQAHSILVRSGSAAASARLLGARDTARAELELALRLEAS